MGYSQIPDRPANQESRQGVGSAVYSREEDWQSLVGHCKAGYGLHEAFKPLMRALHASLILESETRLPSRAAVRADLVQGSARSIAQEPLVISLRVR